MRDAGRDVLALAAFYAGSFFCHSSIPSNAPVMPGARIIAFGGACLADRLGGVTASNFDLKLLFLAGNGLGLAFAGPGIGMGRWPRTGN